MESHWHGFNLCENAAMNHFVQRLIMDGDGSGIRPTFAIFQAFGNAGPRKSKVYFLCKKGRCSVTI
jgi:hypothetical protein